MLACNKNGGMMVVFKRLQSSCGEYVPTRLLDMTLVGLLLHHVIVVSLLPLALTYLPEYDSTESQGLSMLERVTTYRSILFPKYSGVHKPNHIVFPSTMYQGGRANRFRDASRVFPTHRGGIFFRPSSRISYHRNYGLRDDWRLRAVDDSPSHSIARNIRIE